MKTKASHFRLRIIASLGLSIAKPVLADAPNIQTTGPIHLADNHGEEA
ncbi:hypothetical protein OS189_02640 [Sulfitobacter sp. F26169L]|nr:hypothetical protein [Sulfitobacter sp. F26169L]MCX7565242.1 hypothetical protein [Sulfitobacter sp. F26169L]